MRKHALRWVVPALLATVLAVPVLTAREGPKVLAAGDEIPGQYIVVLKDGSELPDAAASRARNAHGVAVDHVYTSALRGYAFRGSAAAAARIARDAGVAYVIPDRVVRASGAAPAAPATIAAATQSVTEAPTGVRRIGAATSVTIPDNVTVAVIDTGIDLKHPDLNATNGKTCVIGTKNANDDNGHGTHVTGTIGAKANGQGVVGVAPGVRIYAVKVLNRNGSGSWGSVICGIDWVTANAASKNIKVANMSLGGTGVATPSDSNCKNLNNDALHTAICKSVTAADVTYVVAAGNSAEDASGFVPAAYDEVITVSALSDSDGAPGGVGGAPTCRPTEGDDTFASFSNFGDKVDIAAPGVCITSTWRGGGYATISGTSMASPHVAGVAARLVAAGTSSPSDVKTAILANAEPGPIAGDPDQYKEGVVNAR